MSYKKVIQNVIHKSHTKILYNNSQQKSHTKKCHKICTKNVKKKCPTK